MAETERENEWQRQRDRNCTTRLIYSSWVEGAVGVYWGEECKKFVKQVGEAQERLGDRNDCERQKG